MDDYRIVTEGCGLIDRSERGKLALSGPDAREFLNGQVTNELMTLRPGEGRYAAFLTHKGKMLGDVRILAVGASSSISASSSEVDDVAEVDGAGGTPSELLLDTERVCLQALFDMIRRYKIGYGVELHRRTVERGLLSLLGPEADTVLGEALPTEEHANARVAIASSPAGDRIDALAVRTDLGIDLICEAAHTAALAGALRARGAKPVSEQAAECVRVERGRPRYGVDLDDSVIPQEAALNERAVSFTKGCYVGQETVARLHYKGRPNRHLRGLRLSAPAEHGEELLLEDRSVGRVGSVAVSPTLGPIALALVRREARPGSVLAVGDAGTSAEVLELPFARG